MNNDGEAAQLSSAATPENEAKSVASSRADTFADSSDDLDRADLLARVEVLVEENQRLRHEYVRAQQLRYRRTALAMAVIGLVATLGGLAFPGSSDVLFALGGTGLLVATATYYLTPEHFVAAPVGEAVYTALTRERETLCSELGLQTERLYVPRTDDGAVGESSVRLYVPQHADYRIPDGGDLEDILIVTDTAAERGLSFWPSATILFEEFREGLPGAMATAPDVLAIQLADAVVEQFELAASATPDVDLEQERVTIAIAGSAYGSLTRFDHPIPSLIATGLAAGLGKPVHLEVAEADASADALVTCTWDVEDPPD